MERAVTRAVTRVGGHNGPCERAPRTIDAEGVVNSSVLASLGWSDRETFDVEPRVSVGRVVIMHGANADVTWQTPDGREDSGLCSLARGLATTPVAGDWVVVREGRIVEVKDRRNELRRPHPYGREPQVMAANIDLVLIVVAMNADLNLRFLERLSMMARDSRATPIIIATKVDDTEEAQEFAARVHELDPEVLVIVTSSRTGEGVDEVGARLSTGITAVMLGASGVGKTSLLNALEGLEETTKSVSRGGEGRHATSTRKLYRLRSGGVLLDIPGIRLPEAVADQRSLEMNFDDIEEIALRCRFRNCRHDGDDGCEIQVAVQSGELDEGRLVAWRDLHASATQSSLEAPRERRKARGSLRGPVE